MIICKIQVAMRPQAYTKVYPILLVTEQYDASKVADYKYMQSHAN